MSISIKSRRSFLQSATASGAGLLIFPSGKLFGDNPLSGRLNIALIGAYGRAKAHYSFLKRHNVVAICDVHDVCLGYGAEQFPKARQYKDWRRCLDQKDIEAVVICTPDHTHAHISSWALNRGYHTYCEKPLGISVHEARYCRKKWASNERMIATQVGTQRHANPNFARIRELVRDGAIGELREVHAWGNREFRHEQYPPAEGPPPSGLDWDLWIGPSPWHPYNPQYFQHLEGPVSNGRNWNVYWDFGAGQVGDMGSHTMDLVWNAVDGDLPTEIQATGEPFNPDVVPVDLRASFTLPPNAWRPAIRISWWQGGLKPKMPAEFIDILKIGHGALFVGSKGFLISDFDRRLIFPYGKDADLTYFSPRPQSELTPSPSGFQEEWANACREGTPTSCDFNYSGRMMEMMFLGLVAYRAGATIQYDGSTGRIIGNPDAQQFLSRTYREGWPLDG